MNPGQRAAAGERAAASSADARIQPKNQRNKRRILSADKVETEYYNRPGIICCDSICTA